MLTTLAERAMERRGVSADGGWRMADGGIRSQGVFQFIEPAMVAGEGAALEEVDGFDFPLRTAEMDGVA